MINRPRPRACPGSARGAPRPGGLFDYLLLIVCCLCLIVKLFACLSLLCLFAFVLPIAII